LATTGRRRRPVASHRIETAASTVLAHRCDAAGGPTRAAHSGLYGCSLWPRIHAGERELPARRQGASKRVTASRREKPCDHAHRATTVSVEVSTCSLADATSGRVVEADRATS